MSEETRPQGVGRGQRAVLGLVVIAILLMVGLFGLRLMRINYLETPIDRLWPPPEFAGEGESMLPDGVVLKVQTTGFDKLSDAEKAARAPVRLRVRAFRPETAGGQTTLWVNAIDREGRSIPQLDQADFELFEADRPVPRFGFDKSIETRPPSFAPPFIWIANSGENTVSKLSTRTGEEVGRYKVGANPSRTSVDLDGNVFVASRDSHEITKIKAVGCEGQGCVLFTRPTCHGARGLAVDSENRVWVGGKNPEGTLGCLQLFDGETGELAFEARDLPGLVYGLVIDQDGVLWGVIQSKNRLLKVSRTGRILDMIEAPAPAGLYGIAVDPQGLVWLGNNVVGDVLRFDPRDETWARFASGQKLTTRGVAADVAGNIWVASSNPSKVSRFEGSSGKWLGDFDTGGTEPVGIAIDADQFVWVVNRMSNNASKLDPETGAIVSTHVVGAQPYTYSDMTGYALNNFVSSKGLYQLSYHHIPFQLRISSPEEGDTLPALSLKPVELEVRLTSFDPHDPLVKVAWSVDGESVGVVREAPFSLTWKARELAEGAHTIKAVGTSRSGFTDEDQIAVKVIQTFGRVRVGLVREGQELASVPRTIVFVIDSSGSMWGMVGDERKIDAAKGAVLDILRDLPQDTRVALRVYGRRSMKCTDTELLVPLGPPDRPELEKAVLGLRPKGRTPIATALEKAVEDLEASGGSGHLGERMAVLVTDGIETCKGEPCEVAGRTNEGDIKLRVNVIGFGLDKKVDRSSLKCMASATGGIYADADDARGLSRGLARAVEVSWTVVDEGGREAKVGSMKRASVVLPVGRYRVRFGAPDQVGALESELFELPSQAEVRVTLSLEDKGPPKISLEQVPESGQ